MSLKPEFKNLKLEFEIVKYFSPYTHASKIQEFNYNFGQADPMSLMTLVLFSSPKVLQLPSNLFINVMDHNKGFFFILIRKCHNFCQI
jgi:hypothetical protein